MELFRLLGRIAIDNDQANRALDETARRADESGGRTSSAFERIGGAARTIGTAVLGTGAALGGAFIAAVEGTREYRTEMGKLDTAFVTNGHSSEAAKNTFSELNAVLGDSAVSVEAANHLAVMTDNEKDLQTWTDICTGVFATFGDSLPIEGLTESANETAKVGEVTGPLADALNWAGISEDKFNEQLAACTSEQERQKLIMDTLNGTYKEASDRYKETNKDVMNANRAHERLKDAFAELGRVGEPILTAIKTKTADMVEAAVPKVEAFIQKVRDLKKWIKENESTIDAWVAVILGASVSIGSFLVVMKWGAIMGGATKAIRGVQVAMLLFNAALRANPIGLVVTLIAGLVAAFLYLWKNNEGFREFWIGLWEKIKDVCGVAIRWIKVKFHELKAAGKTVKETFDKIKSDITEKINGAKDAVEKAIEKIKGFFDFDWSLPKPKIPSFTLEGEFSLKPPKVPKIGINWHADGGVFDRPTVLPSMAGWQGVGEAGKEAIAPIDVLKSYVREAVQDENENVGRIVIEQMQLLLDYLKRYMPRVVVLDSGAMVGELTPAIDARLSARLQDTMRGNTR